jgi:ATP-dependent DNA helicase PIF1
LLTACHACVRCAGKGDTAALVRKVQKSSAAVNRWSQCKVLIVDEISMLNYEVFEALDAIARAVRESDKPFGGLQLVVVGDFMQLPPVVKERKNLKFCFQSPVWEESGLNAPGGRQFLSQVERQKDVDFVTFLNQVRVGRATDDRVNQLNHCLTSVKPLPDNGIVPTKLYSINKEVDEENRARLVELPGEPYKFVAEDRWRMKPSKAALVPIFRSALDAMIPEEIELKVGAQVMLLRNRMKGQFGAFASSMGPSLVNGSRGKVVAIVESTLKPGKR